MNNKYIKRSHLSERKFRQLIFGFSIDMTATQISLLTGVNRNTVNRIILLLRKRLAQECEEGTVFSGEIELDESYFGAGRKKGKRGRGASDKTIVFGIYKRGGNLHTQIIHNCSRDTLEHIIKKKIAMNSIIY